MRTRLCSLGDWAPESALSSAGSRHVKHSAAAFSSSSSLSSLCEADGVCSLSRSVSRSTAAASSAAASRSTSAGSAPCASRQRTTSTLSWLAAICSAEPDEPTKLTCAPREMRNWMSATEAPCETARLRGELPSPSVQLTSAPSRTTICTRERSLDGMAVLVRKLLRMKAGATRCRLSVERPMPEPKGMSAEPLSFAATSSSCHMTRNMPSSSESRTVPSPKSPSIRRAITDSPTAYRTSSLRLVRSPSSSFTSSSCCVSVSATSSTHVQSCEFELTCKSAGWSRHERARQALRLQQH